MARSHRQKPKPHRQKVCRWQSGSAIGKAPSATNSSANKTLPIAKVYTIGKGFADGRGALRQSLHVTWPPSVSRLVCRWLTPRGHRQTWRSWPQVLSPRHLFSDGPGHRQRYGQFADGQFANCWNPCFTGTTMTSVRSTGEKAHPTVFKPSPLSAANSGKTSLCGPEPHRLEPICGEVYDLVRRRLRLPRPVRNKDHKPTQFHSGWIKRNEEHTRTTL